MKSNTFSVIMAGGTGTRFWPLSTKNKPKQFLDILGTGRTLLRQTFDRLSRISPVENIYVVTNEIYHELVKEQLPELSENQILLEPEKKNTAPCIAYANYKIRKINPEANIVVSPSDHLIQYEEQFIEILREGLDFTENHDALLTLGIKPHRPETGYGYIQRENNKEVDGYKNLYKVKTFTEKPSYDLAKKFYESGEYFWNSGIFIWSLQSIMKAFTKHLPDVDQLFKEAEEIYHTPDESDVITNIYFKSKSISIDYGIMEKSNNVYVLASSFGWADLGTWGSLQEFLHKDENGNSVYGNNVMLYDVEDSIVDFSNDKMVVIKGLKDYIVVESDNKLIIYNKKDEQEIKQIVEEIKENKGEEYI
ncbi:MAG: mannose-1-phosphate guanylyltransferase [Bacteroidales bacterium]|nr:mannose-1-phosphate guanylyltransferase [Bacteroidales bacterium]